MMGGLPTSHLHSVFRLNVIRDAQSNPLSKHERGLILVRDYHCIRDDTLIHCDFSRLTSRSHQLRLGPERTKTSRRWGKRSDEMGRIGLGNWDAKRASAFSNSLSSSSSYSWHRWGERWNCHQIHVSRSRPGDTFVDNKHCPKDFS